MLGAPKLSLWRLNLVPINKARSDHLARGLWLPLFKMYLLSKGFSIIVRHCFMVIISVLTLGWVMEETHFVYLCEANGSVVRLVCAGKCGDGLEGDRFTCGGSGGETAQGVEDGTSPRSGSCGGGAAVWALRLVWGSGRDASSYSHTLTPPVEEAWVWTVWICKGFTWASKCACWEIRAFSGGSFPWCPSTDTSHRLLWEWDLCPIGSQHVNLHILL